MGGGRTERSRTAAQAALSTDGTGTKQSIRCVERFGRRDREGGMDLIGALLLSIFAGALLTEIYVWLPKISARLTIWAVQRLPCNLRSRYREEWEEFQAAIPNSLLRLVNAVGFHIAATHLNISGRSFRPKSLYIRLFIFTIFANARLARALVLKPSASCWWRKSYIWFQSEKRLGNIQGKRRN